MGVCADRRAEFLLLGHGLDGMLSGSGRKGEKGHMCGRGSPGDGDFQGTAGPRDADILSLPAAHPQRIRGSCYSRGHQNKKECHLPPRAPAPYFSFHSVWKEPDFRGILSAMAISSSLRAKELLDDSQKGFDPAGSLSGV